MKMNNKPKRQKSEICLDIIKALFHNNGSLIVTKLFRKANLNKLMLDEYINHNGLNQLLDINKVENKVYVTLKETAYKRISEGIINIY